ncbi:MAG: hypothetical protein EPO12_01630 [Aquabacterium sp.]|nr:MAG: hypothetical protein EPO12_01630 [Aquabacterium sp.]
MHSPVSSPSGSAGETRGHFLNRRGLRLSYALHRPAGASTRAWLFCNALLEEKTFSHRTTVNLARCLAAMGQPVLRFDYAGTGDSEDLPVAARGEPPTWTDDVADAAGFLRSQVAFDSLHLLALRSAALVAASAAASVAATRLLLLEPTPDGQAWLQEGLRANLTTQLSCFKKVVETREQMAARLHSGDTVNVHGHEIDAGFSGLVGGWRLAELLELSRARADLVHLSRKGGAAAPAAWQTLATGGQVTLHACHAPPMWAESKQHDDAPAALIALLEKLAADAAGDAR